MRSISQFRVKTLGELSKLMSRCKKGSRQWRKYNKLGTYSSKEQKPTRRVGTQNNKRNSLIFKEEESHSLRDWQCVRH